MDFTTIEATPSTSMASAVSVSTTPFSTAVTPTLTSITTTSSTPRRPLGYNCLHSHGNTR